MPVRVPRRGHYLRRTVLVYFSAYVSSLPLSRCCIICIYDAECLSVLCWLSSEPSRYSVNMNAAISSAVCRPWWEHALPWRSLFKGPPCLTRLTPSLLSSLASEQEKMWRPPVPPLFPPESFLISALLCCDRPLCLSLLLRCILFLVLNTLLLFVSAGSIRQEQKWWRVTKEKQGREDIVYST